MNDTTRFAIIDDDAVELENANIPLSDANYAYGIGVYETLRQRGGLRYFTQMHLERLFESARIIGLSTDADAQRMISRLNRLRDLNPEEDVNIRILLVKSGPKNSRSYIFPADIPRVKGVEDLRVPEPVGVTMLGYPGERHFPRAKSLSMLLSSVALAKAKERDCWDALLLDRDGLITEGSRSNVFWMQGGRLYSPPEDRILAGVTRANIIACAEKAGFEFRYGELYVEDLAREPRTLICSSTSIGLQPVTTLFMDDGREISLPRDPAVGKLSRSYGDFIRNEALTD